MKRRIISLALSLVLLTAIFAGCTSAGGESSSAPPEEGAASSESTDSSSPDSSGETESSESGTSEIKWSGTISTAPYRFGPIINDTVTPEIEKRLLEYGYDVTFEEVFIDNTQFTELINLRVASGDAPDSFKAPPESYHQYASQGAIASWDEEFLRSNAPTVAAYIDSGGPEGSNTEITDMTWKMFYYGDKMMIIPQIARQNGPLLVTMYNKTWMDKLGAEAPKTVDEFVELAYRFANEDPDGNGQKDTYGLSTTYLNVIFGAYGSFPGFLHMAEDSMWYDVDGKLVASSVMPGNKEALGVIRQLYADGVLDPEFVTGENTGGYWALSQAFINQRIGVTHSSNLNHNYPSFEGRPVGTVLQEYKAVNGEDAEVVFGPFISGPNGDYGGLMRISNRVGEGTVFSAKLNDDPEKLAAIFQIMDIFANDLELARLAQNGFEGIHYNFTDIPGEMVSTEAYPDNASKQADGVWALRGIYGPESTFNEELNKDIPTLYNLWFKEMRASDPQLGYDAGYYSDMWGTLETSSDYAADLMTYRDETWLKIIQGTLDVDYYDTYVDEWYSRGGQAMTDEANEWYAENQ